MGPSTIVIWDMKFEKLVLNSDVSIKFEAVLLTFGCSLLIFYCNDVIIFDWVML